MRCVGLCARYAVQTLGLGGDRACVIYHSGQVYDANENAIERRIAFGMPLKEAKVILQGDGAFVEYKRELFESARHHLLDPCLKYSDQIEAGLAAEGLIDLSGHPEPYDIASILLTDVYQQVRLPLIVGLAPSVWLAKKSASLCDSRALELGILPIEPISDAREWLKSKPVSFLSPIEESDRRKLHHLGFDQVGQVQRASVSQLEAQFPKRGALIYQVANGKYCDSVCANYPERLISTTVALGASENFVEIDGALLKLAQELAERLCRLDYQAKTVVLTVYLESGVQARAHKKLTRSVSSATSIYVGLGQLFKGLDISEPVERISVQLLDLTQATSRQSVLQLGQNDSDAQKHIAATLKRIESTHGTGAVRVASSFQFSFNQQVLTEWKRVTSWR